MDNKTHHDYVDFRVYSVTEFTWGVYSIDGWSFTGCHDNALLYQDCIEQFTTIPLHSITFYYACLINISSSVMGYF